MNSIGKGRVAGYGILDLAAGKEEILDRSLTIRLRTAGQQAEFIGQSIFSADAARCPSFQLAVCPVTHYSYCALNPGCKRIFLKLLVGLDIRLTASDKASQSCYGFVAVFRQFLSHAAKLFANDLAFLQPCPEDPGGDISDCAV